MIKAPRAEVLPLRDRVRAAVRDSPALRRERRLHRGPRTVSRYFGGVLVSFLPSCILVAYFQYLLVANLRVPHHEALLAVLFGHFMPVWALLATLVRAGQITQLFKHGSDLYVPYFLPVSNLEAFDHQNHRLWLFSLRLILDFLTFGALVAFYTSASFAGWSCVILFALAQAATSLALAWLMDRWLSRKLRVWLFLFLLALSAAWIAAVKFAAPALEHLVLAGFTGIALVTPSGWLTWGFCQVVVSHSLLGWLSLLVVPALAVPAVRLCRFRRLAFRMETIFHYAPSDEAGHPAAAFIPAEDDDLDSEVEAAAPVPASPPVAVSSTLLLPQVTAALAAICARPPAQNALSTGPFEHALARLLSPRERVLIDAMQVPLGNGALRWLQGCTLILCVPILQHLPMPELIADMIHALVPFFLVIIALLMNLPIFGHGGLGFAKTGLYQSASPIYTCFPVGFWEICRLELKICAYRAVLGLPLILLAAYVIFPSAAYPLLFLIMLSLKAGYLILCIQPGWLIARFSSGSNDTGAGAFRAVALLFVIIGGLFGVGLLGYALLALTNQFVAWAAGLGLCVVSFGVLAIYGRLYNHPRFDLVTVPK
jgi:hypothetical protein